MMRIGLIEPHLQRFGGIRRMVEFANRLVERGHDVTFFLPPGQELSCGWMRCDARVSVIQDTPLDVIVFNDERQWFLLDRFPSARRRIFYALHDGALYGKGGSWESLRVPVDLRLANSTWTADQVERRIGERPVVQFSGIDRSLFRPQHLPKRHDVLTSGSTRWWKGADTVREAATLAGVGCDTYEDLDLAQDRLARMYDQARVFAVGSHFEGFGQPGLEALACGVPLVTTDNGGCRDYAIDGETALVVPPGDVEAMAAAFRRLLDEPTLAESLAANGLDLVADRFDWETRTDELVAVLDGVVAGPSAAVPGGAASVSVAGDPPAVPELTVVVLAWNNLELTQECVQSVRAHTDVDYELVIVDNGSTDDTAAYAAQAADRAVLHPTNTGFAHGMNSGLEVARGRVVAFCNNDTVLPAGWAGRLLATLDAAHRPGIVVPAVTTAQNQATVRTRPGTTTSVFDPFTAPPSAVIYLSPTALMREIGGWDESYLVASGEDVDLAFTVWCNGFDIVFDERVLVDHVGKASARQLDDWEGRWAHNRQQFLNKWQGHDAVARVADIDDARFERNRRTAAAAARWMAEYFAARDQLRREHQLGARALSRRLAGRTVRGIESSGRDAAAGSARRVLRVLPEPLAHRARRLGRPMRARLRGTD